MSNAEFVFIMVYFGECLLRNEMKFRTKCGKLVLKKNKGSLIFYDSIYIPDYDTRRLHKLMWVNGLSKPLTVSRSTWSLNNGAFAKCTRGSRILHESSEDKSLNY